MDIIDQLKLMEGGRTGPYPRDQTIREARETIERLRAAILWALGEGVDENGLGFGEADAELGTKRRYWWRVHLRKLAGLDPAKAHEQREPTR